MPRIDTPQTMETATKMPTTLLGHGSDWWNSVGLVSLGLVAVVAILVMLAQAGVIVVQRRESSAAKAAFEKYKVDAKRDADIEIGKARAEADSKIGKAQADADSKIVQARTDADVKIKAARDEAEVKIAEAIREASRANESAAQLKNANLVLQNQINEVRLPRGFSDAEFAATVEALKPFAGTPFDLAVTPNDRECAALMRQIFDVLVAAGWRADGYHLAGPGTVARYDQYRPDIPPFGEFVGAGVEIWTSKTDLPKFKNAANALMQALLKTNPPLVGTSGSSDEKLPNGEIDPLGIPGAIHVKVGGKF
jgi:hypothetical protein